MSDWPSWRTRENTADKLYEVAKKIVRGCEYWFGEGRFIEPPYELQVFFAHESDVPDVVRMFSGFNAIHFGPGFRVRRGAVREDSLSAIYEVVVWDSLTFYATILTSDEPPVRRVSMGPIAILLTAIAVIVGMIALFRSGER